MSHSLQCQTYVTDQTELLVPELNRTAYWYQLGYNRTILESQGKDEVNPDEVNPDEVNPDKVIKLNESTHLD